MWPAVIFMRLRNSLVSGAFVLPYMGCHLAAAEYRNIPPYDPTCENRQLGTVGGYVLRVY